MIAQAPVRFAPADSPGGQSNKNRRGWAAVLTVLRPSRRLSGGDHCPGLGASVPQRAGVASIGR